jgi:3-dehydroquinate synthase
MQAPPRPETQVEFTVGLPVRDLVTARLGFTPQKILVIADAKARFTGMRAWLKQFSVVLEVKSGEKIKDLERFPGHVRAISRKLGDADPAKCAVMAVGDQSIADFAGFFAAVLKSGRPLIYVPTTLAAVIGAKNSGRGALNLGERGGLLATANPPAAIFVVHDLLAGQSEDRLQDALAELAKAALVCGGDLFARLAENRSWDFASLWSLLPAVLAAKVEFVSQESNAQLGYTMGQALAAHYKLEPGEATGLGLVFTAEWSQHRGYLMPNEFEVVREVLHDHLAVPTVDEFLEKHKPVNRRKLTSLLAGQKEISARKNLEYIFLEGIGRPRRLSVPLESLLTEAGRQGWVAQ